MVHERLQGNIVGEDCLGRLRCAAVGACRMRGGRIQLRKEEAGLGTSCVANDESGEWKSILYKFLSHVNTGSQTSIEPGIRSEQLTLASSLGWSSMPLKFS